MASSSVGKFANVKFESAIIIIFKFIYVFFFIKNITDYDEQ